jgi:transposase-like protein
MAEWPARRLDPLYPVIFVDAIRKSRSGTGRSATPPATSFYVVMGVTTHGEREIPGIWAGDGTAGARFSYTGQVAFRAGAVALRVRQARRSEYGVMQRRISRSVRPSARRRTTYSRV